MFQWAHCLELRSYNTKLLFSDLWRHFLNAPRKTNLRGRERFSKLRSSSPDSGIVKEEIIDYDDSVKPAPTEYEKVKYWGQLASEKEEMRTLPSRILCTLCRGRFGLLVGVLIYTYCYNNKTQERRSRVRTNFTCPLAIRECCFIQV